MTRSWKTGNRFEGFAGRDLGAVARWERHEAGRRLRGLSAEEGCAELARLFAIFGRQPAGDLGPLAERDERERLDLVARRQAAFRALSGSGARGPAEPG